MNRFEEATESGSKNFRQPFLYFLKICYDFFQAEIVPFLVYFEEIYCKLKYFFAKPFSIFYFFFSLLNDGLEKCTKLRIILFFYVFVIDYKRRIKLKLPRIDLDVKKVVNFEFAFRAKKCFEFNFFKSKLFLCKISDDNFLHLTEIAYKRLGHSYDFASYGFESESKLFIDILVCTHYICLLLWQLTCFLFYRI